MKVSILFKKSCLSFLVLFANYASSAQGSLKSCPRRETKKLCHHCLPCIQYHKSLFTGDFWGGEILGLMLFYFFPSPYQVKNNNFWRTTVTKVSTHLCNFQPQICFFFEKSTACFFLNFDGKTFLMINRGTE